jgi:hypothetical protein
MRSYDRIQAAFPGDGEPAQVVVRAADVTAPPVRAAIAELDRLARAGGRRAGPAGRVGQPGPGPRGGQRAAARRRHRRGVRGGARGAADPHRPGHGRARPRRARRGDRPDRRLAGLQRDDAGEPALRLRVRARARVSCCCS